MTNALREAITFVRQQHRSYFQYDIQFLVENASTERGVFKSFFVPNDTFNKVRVKCVQ